MQNLDLKKRIVDLEREESQQRMSGNESGTPHRNSFDYNNNSESSMREDTSPNNIAASSNSGQQSSSHLQQSTECQVMDTLAAAALKAKRHRMPARLVVRKFTCEVQGCRKQYGSEGSLNQHIKLKHPGVKYVSISSKRMQSGSHEEKHNESFENKDFEDE